MQPASSSASAPARLAKGSSAGNKKDNYRVWQQTLTWRVRAGCKGKKKQDTTVLGPPQRKKDFHFLGYSTLSLFLGVFFGGGWGGVLFCFLLSVKNQEGATDRRCPGVESRLPCLADELKRQDQKIKCYLCSAKGFQQVYISVCIVE